MKRGNIIIKDNCLINGFDFAVEELTGKKLTNFIVGKRSSEILRNLFEVIYCFIIQI